MLADLYLRVGDLESTSKLFARIKEQYGFFDEVQNLSARIDIAAGHINSNVVRYFYKRIKSYLMASFRLAL